MNAKETLQKIAEALNIVSEQKQVEQPEIETPIVETKPEVEIVEVQIEPLVLEPTPEIESQIEPQIDLPVKEEKTDFRYEELEKQLQDLKQILSNALAQPPPELPEIPAKQPKGLTHSPETPVKKTATKIGQQGDSIMNRVFKYMNNN